MKNLAAGSVRRKPGIAAALLWSLLESPLAGSELGVMNERFVAREVAIEAAIQGLLSSKNNMVER
jgi:hypothetical protein